MNEIHVVPKKQAVAWKLFISTIVTESYNKKYTTCMQNL